jgi:quercetin dioxygenase-like cupin family protein
MNPGVVNSFGTLQNLSAIPPTPLKLIGPVLFGNPPGSRTVTIISIDILWIYWKKVFCKPFFAGVKMSNEKKQAGIQAAKALQLNQLVDYAQGATVSRIIAKNSAGNVTLFAFDEGQGLSEHSTPFDALVQVIDGEAELTIGGESVVAKTGQVVLMPANIPHAVNAVRQFKMLLTMLKGS